MYTIKLDYIDASRVYIYEETEDGIRYRMTVYQDYDLAKRIVEILNDEQANSQA